MEEESTGVVERQTDRGFNRNRDIQNRPTKRQKDMTENRN